MTNTNESSATQYSTVNDRIRQVELANFMAKMAMIDPKIKSFCAHLDLLSNYFEAMNTNKWEVNTFTDLLITNASNARVDNTVSELLGNLELLFQEANLSITTILSSIDIETDNPWLDFLDNFKLYSFITPIRFEVHLWHYILDRIKDTAIFPDTLREYYDLHDSEVCEDKISAFYEAGLNLQKSINNLQQYSTMLGLKESLPVISSEPAADETLVDEFPIGEHFFPTAHVGPADLNDSDSIESSVE